jgi:cation diffusion facilitator CzcD-associated flavoprotein CzcO
MSLLWLYWNFHRYGTRQRQGETAMSDSQRSSSEVSNEFDAVIVGAGFSGMYMLHRLRGLGLSARVFEAGSGVGGTWYWNRYPGARCDTETLEYSYSFSDELQQEWSWSERYAGQAELLTYANHVADRFDLWRDMQFHTRVLSAIFDETTHLWTVRTDAGDAVRARFCIMATGCLSTAQVPDFKGLDSFQGTWYHTGNWPHHDVDFSGQRVGVIGTGSSAIQSIPIIASQAAHLTVFQRTPNFSIPAWNAPMDPEVERQYKAAYLEYRKKARESRRGYAVDVSDQPALSVTPEERERIFEEQWRRGGLHFLTGFGDLYTSKEANDTAAEFVRAKIRETVHDPATAEALLPDSHPIGTKRLCVDSHYYETYNRENVTLVDLRKDPLVEITQSGIRTENAEHELDSIVFATGYDAMTGTLTRIDIRGRGGIQLKEKWAEGPRTYLGVAVSGFPNLFTVTGPGSPSVLSNMMVSIEQHIDWITECIEYLSERNLQAIEATPEAEERWVQHVNEVAHSTLYPQAGSWYMGMNVPGKPRVFMPYVGGVGHYRRTCDAVAANGYEGFSLSP